MAHVADNLLQQWNNFEGEAAVGGINLGLVLTEARRDGVHLSLGLLHGDSGFERGNNVVVLMPANGGGGICQRQRHKNVGLLGAIEKRQHFLRQNKALRQNSNHLISRAVERDGAADDVRIRTKAAHPHAIGQHRRGGMPEGIFVRGKETAVRWRGAKRR